MTTNSLTMNHEATTSLLDAGVQGLIGQPLDRYEGKLKVAGQATYAAEYPVEHLAYGYLVQARKGAGTVRSIDVDAAKAIPGVVDVIVDHKTMACVAAQGGQTSAPTKGRKSCTSSASRSRSWLPKAMRRRATRASGSPSAMTRRRAAMISSATATSVRRPRRR